MSLGTQIKQRRKALGLTQQELADKLNLSRSTVANWEIDRNYPDIKLLLSISKILDITLEELLTENDDLVERISSDTIVEEKTEQKNKNPVLCSHSTLPDPAGYGFFQQRSGYIRRESYRIGSDKRQYAAYKNRSAVLQKHRRVSYRLH